MQATPLPSIAALRAQIGAPPHTSPWLRIDQPTIDRFADVTRDHQWIHVDVERARRESPLKRTIAHGFLGLSLLPCLVNQVFSYPGRRSALNYGFDRIRFTAPAPADAEVRVSVAIAEVADVGADEARVAFDLTLQVNGSERPAIVARWLVQMRF